jgi:uncharacterized membrane protein (UPF0127 family)
MDISKSLIRDRCFDTIMNVKILKHGEVLLDEVKYCESLFSRLKGLMFTKKLKHNQGALLVLNSLTRTNAAIHMWFVFYPLMIYWMDESGKVVDMKKVYPFQTLIVPRKKAKYVLECLGLQGVNVGDVLRIAKNRKV